MPRRFAGAPDVVRSRANSRLDHDAFDTALLGNSRAGGLDAPNPFKTGGTKKSLNGFEGADS
jgi:hypothetical protein